MKNKTRFGLAGIVLAGSLGLGGCVTVDLKDVLNPEMTQEEKDAYFGKVDIHTPQGYTFTLRHQSSVYYRGENYLIGQVDPPYVSLYPPKWFGVGQKRIVVPISELDMMKK